jgi:Arc/MetJ-type ribon-helix-helix transcriptional regulator
MTDMTVSLPEPVKQFVDSEAAAAGFASSGDYVQD